MAQFEGQPNGSQASIKSSGISKIAFPDVLGQILDLTAAEAFDKALNDITADHSNITPLHLSHVNQKWREIALSTPAIWSRIHLKLGMSPYTVFRKRQPALLRISIDNAGEHGLTVHITGDVSESSDEELDLLEIILQSSSRWVALYRDLALPLTSTNRFAERLDGLWTSLTGHLGRLRLLELRSSAYSSAFHNLPLLKRLTGPVPWTGVNYPNLEILRTHDVSSFSNFLPSFPLLRDASIFRRGFREPGNFTLVHNNLRRLGFPSDMLAESTISFDLPALEAVSFALNVGIFSSVRDPSDLAQGLAHVEALSSQCGLHSLRVSLALITTVTSRSPTFCRLLQGNLSQLTHLHLVESANKTSSTSELHLPYLHSSMNGTGPGLLPCLVDLTYHLHDNGVAPTIYEVVLEYVSVRFNMEDCGGTSNKLSHFNFRSSGSQQMPAAFVERLRSLSDSGLSVTISRLSRDNTTWDSISMIDRTGA